MLVSQHKIATWNTRCPFRSKTKQRLVLSTTALAVSFEATVNLCHTGSVARDHVTVALKLEALMVLQTSSNRRWRTATSTRETS